MYRSATVPKPSRETIAQLAKQENLDLTEEELKECQKLITSSCMEMSRLDDMVAPTLPVKYARAPGKTYRPAPEDNKYNAWCYRCDIQGAKEGKLKGRTVAIKDNIPVAHVPLSNGSRLYQGYVPDEDATVVSRVLDAGGLIVGTTNVEDCCVSGNSFTGIHGPVLNPVDHTRSSGGSSCGSAVVVATGDADMALGTDQGGSVRIPASWCGIVGMKPTFGLVPFTGILSLDPMVDHCGPLTRTVADCALLLEVLVVYDDGLDPRQFPNLTVPEYSKIIKNDVKGKRVGFLQEAFECCEENVIGLIQATREIFRNANIDVDDVSVPMHVHGETIYGAIINQGILQNTKGVAFGQKGYKNVALVDFLESTTKTRLNETYETKKLSHLSAKYLEDKGAARYYAKACNLLPKLKRAYDEALEKVDVLVMPTLPYVAPKLPTEKPVLMELGSVACGMIGNLSRFNITGHPALTVNAGFTEDGLPVGVQIVGKHFDDATVLQMAWAFEQQRDHMQTSQ